MECNFFFLLFSLETELTSENTSKCTKKIAVMNSEIYMTVTVPVLPPGYKPSLVALELWPKRRQIRPLYNARPALTQTVAQWLQERKVCAVS